MVRAAAPSHGNRGARSAGPWASHHERSPLAIAAPHPVHDLTYRVRRIRLVPIPPMCSCAVWVHGATVRCAAVGGAGTGAIYGSWPDERPGLAVHTGVARSGPARRPRHEPSTWEDEERVRGKLNSDLQLGNGFGRLALPTAMSATHGRKRTHP